MNFICSRTEFKNKTPRKALRSEICKRMMENKGIKLMCSCDAGLQIVINPSGTAPQLVVLNSLKPF